MFCPKCGTNVLEGSKFCESCGNNMQQSEQSIQQEPEQASPQPTYNSQPAQAYQQPQPQAYNYQPRPQPAPAYQNNSISITDPRDKVYGVGGWLGTMILTIIPLVGFILLLVWAFGSNANKNKKNYAIAVLIFGVIITVLGVFIFASAMTTITDILEQLGGSMGY